jgi:hypothetical protein
MPKSAVLDLAERAKRIPVYNQRGLGGLVNRAITRSADRLAEAK